MLMKLQLKELLKIHFACLFPGIIRTWGVSIYLRVCQSVNIHHCPWWWTWIQSTKYCLPGSLRFGEHLWEGPPQPTPWTFWGTFWEWALWKSPLQRLGRKPQFKIYSVSTKLVFRLNCYKAVTDLNTAFKLLPCDFSLPARRPAFSTMLSLVPKF